MPLEAYYPKSLPPENINIEDIQLTEIESEIDNINRLFNETKNIEMVKSLFMIEEIISATSLET